MEKIAIMTDSNSGITQEEGKMLGITVVPMPFTVNDNEFLEDISISQEQFFDLLGKDADVKTSQPSQFYLENVWRELLKEYETVLYIPMTSGLSGTCENAKSYARNFDGRVIVVDNLRISVTQKISVIEAVNMAKQGRSAQEIKDYLESDKDKFSIYITLSTLKYLCKGGRITPAAAALGNLFKLKPILYTRGQSFDKFAVTMSLGQAKKKMIEKIKSDIEGRFRDEYSKGEMALLVAYSKDRDSAIKFKDEIEKEFANMKVLYVDPLSLSVCCHTGPGTLGIGICHCDYLKNIKENTL